MIMISLALVGHTAIAASQDSAVKRPVRKAPKSAASTRQPAPEAEQPVWPVAAPDPLPGSILPAKRIVAFYGNPLVKRMGILGQLPPDEMLAKLDSEVAKWNAADSTTPVQPWVE